MNNQEAIKILGQYDVSNLHFYTTDGEEIPFTEWSDAIEMAISALKKQMPKKVRITTSTKRCSVCGRQLSGIGNIHPERNYCQKCGQAIDWEEE